MIKVFFRRIHLYLGLGAGLVILVSCLTGAILVFEEELQHAAHHDRYYVTAGASRVSLETLSQNLSAKAPGSTVTGYKVYTDPERSVEVSYKPKGEKKAGKREDRPEAAAQPPAGKGGNGKPAAGKDQGKREQSLKAFMNPYTGEVIELYNHRESFFYKVMDLHRWLLAGDTGKLITGISTLIFLFITITGIILWWPATRKILKQRLKVKWNASGKRLNHDLHVVLGFYASLFLFVFSFTALAWSFEWFNDGIYKVTGSSKERPKAPAAGPTTDGATATLQTALQSVQAAYPDAVYYALGPSKDKETALQVTVLGKNAAHETATDFVYVDPYSGQVTGRLVFSQRNLGARVRSTFRPVHVGSVWGMPGKILAFIACLIGTALPVTGVIMWLNRTRKKRKQTAVPVYHTPSNTSPAPVNG